MPLVPSLCHEAFMIDNISTLNWKLISYNLSYRTILHHSDNHKRLIEIVIYKKKKCKAETLFSRVKKRGTYNCYVFFWNIFKILFNLLISYVQFLGPYPVACKILLGSNLPPFQQKWGVVNTGSPRKPLE